MWIRQLPEDFYKQTSYCYGSVMLWQNKNIYVMDNHLSAAWCWLQSCNRHKKYNFMHIDCHYDMLACFNDEDLESLRNNPNMSYDDFTNLKRTKDIGKKYAVFRWDNYIMATYVLQPNWFHSNIFLTHKVGDICESWGHKPFAVHEICPLYIDWAINQYIGKPSNSLPGLKNDDYKLPWIVNIDIDVFFTAEHVQLYSDEYIRHLAKLIDKNMSNIQVLTIALSPECVKGENMKEKWSNSFHVLKIMAKEIELLKEFPFPQEKNL